MMTLTNQDGTDLVYIDLKPKFVQAGYRMARDRCHIHNVQVANHPKPPKPPAMCNTRLETLGECPGAERIRVEER